MVEVLGVEPDEVVPLGRAVAGLNAYSKGVSLGLFQPTPKGVQEQRRKMRKEKTVTVALLHRAVPGQPCSRPSREHRRSAPPGHARRRSIRAGVLPDIRIFPENGLPTFPGR